MKVALISDVLYGWDGGLDFLFNIASILSRKKDIEVFLFIPKDSTFSKVVKDKILHTRRKEEERKKILLQMVSEIGIEMKTVWYKKMLPRNPYFNDPGILLDKVMREYGIDVALPIMIDSYAHMKTPWISYIPDIQEYHLPNLFSDKERRRRQRRNCKIAKNAQYILATSHFVEKDIEKLFPGKYKIFVTPFAPLSNAKFEIENNVDLNKYHLPKQYFVISNQFWAHKAHHVAFKAMEILFKEGYEDVHLYCTGLMEDWRGNEYIVQLKKLMDSLNCKGNIHLLGYIPKLEQVELIKNATALIQPSKLEGDCGGCSVYLANSLCVTSILSDIDVNIEGRGRPLLSFFKSEDVFELAKVMKEELTKEKRYPTRQNIRNHTEENEKILGKFYYEMLIEVAKEYKGE